MENVALVTFGDPKQALAAIHVVRKPLEEILKSLHGKGPLALKRKRLETIRRQMVGGMVVADMDALVIGIELLLACLRRSRIGEKPIGLEQSDTEHERERDPALRGPHDAR